MFVTDNVVKDIGIKKNLKRVSKKKSNSIILEIDEDNEIVIQVNGKRRAEVETRVGASEEEVMKAVKNIISVSEQIQNSVIVKKIFIPNKILNIVISKNE